MDNNAPQNKKISTLKMEKCSLKLEKCTLQLIRAVARVGKSTISYSIRIVRTYEEYVHTFVHVYENIFVHSYTCTNERKISFVRT